VVKKSRNVEMDINKLTEAIIGAAIEVHRELGPGLLESVYEQCLAHELMLMKIGYTVQQALPVEYKGIKLDCGYRIDMVVEKQVLIELKSIEKVADIHVAQILTYMKLAKIKLGLLINFNVKMLKDGVRRFVV
jgi:GxxExxY protein